MKQITKIDAVPLATGIQKILLDMIKEKNIDPNDAKYPIKEFERLIVQDKGVSKKEAERVTEAVINTRILRWEIFGNNFIL